jgi:hypothetical protein
MKNIETDKNDWRSKQQNITEIQRQWIHSSYEDWARLLEVNPPDQ